MLARRLLVLLAVCTVPALAAAEIEAGDIPGQAEWYLHADLDAMRGARSGSALYRWLNDEVFVDIQEDIGIDLEQEIDTVTAFADAALGTVIVVEGPISKETRDKVLALAAVKARLDTFTHDGHTLHRIQDRGESAHRQRSLEDFDGSAWFSFDLENRLVVTSERNQLEAQLVSRDPTVAQSLGGIINGLISLQALNSDLDPEILAMIQNTKIEILDNVLSINTVFDPDAVARLLEEK